MQPATPEVHRLPIRLYLPMAAMGLFMVLTWAAVAVNYYDRHNEDGPARIAGHLTDGEKWRLAKEIRKVGSYPLSITYYPDQSKIGREIADVSQSGGMTVQPELADNILADGITVAGRKNNPHIQQFADLLSRAYGGEPVVSKEIEGFSGDSLSVSIGSP